MLENEIVDINIVSNNETGKIEIIETPHDVPLKSFIEPIDYGKNPMCVQCLKLPEIRKLLKYYKSCMVIPRHNSSAIRHAKRAIRKIHDFALVGNKKVVLQRLISYFEQENAATVIEKHIRGFFVRQFCTLLGPAKQNRKLCVNDTDFSTLEPIENIPYDDFYSYQDNGDYIYGFQLSSLIAYRKSQKASGFKNPYNRLPMKRQLSSIYRLIRLRKIVVTKYIPEKRQVQNKVTHVKREQIQQSSFRNAENVEMATHSSYDNTSQRLFQQYRYNPQEMIEKLRDIRTKSVLERCRFLFSEIDVLGNYSSYAWFLNLERRKYLRYFRILRDIWNYRGQIPSSIRFKICPLWDPFMVITMENTSELSVEQLQTMCLSVMEDMVYTGVNVEFKTLGSLHVLSVLTIVSYEARNAMPWLYEALL
jgi:hypothetical protein